MLLTNQFLQVELIVHQDDQPEFERRVKEFLDNDGFDRFDEDSNKHLVLALRTPEPIVYSGYLRRQSSVLQRKDEFVTRGKQVPDSEPCFFRYVHLWRLGQITDLDLARLMRLSADDKEYRAIDNLVVRETQDVVFRVPWLSDLPEISGEGRLNLVRITRQLSPRELGTYLFSLGALIPTLERDGYHTMGLFQNITGLLNTVTEYWKTDDSDLTPLHRTPGEVSKLVFGNSPLEKEIDDLHRKVTFSQERYQSYLPLERLHVNHVGRRWFAAALETAAGQGW